MFKVGQKYEFRMLEGDGEVTFWGTIEAYEHPLIKLADSPPMEVRIAFGQDTADEVVRKTKGAPGRILNVTSPNFISAQQQESE